VFTRNVDSLEYFQLLARSKGLSPDSRHPTVRLALLSDAATQQFVPLLRVLFSEIGLNAEIYEGAFDSIETEVYNDHSSLYLSNPDVICLLHSTQGLRSKYYRRLGSGQEFAEYTARHITELWTAIRKRTSALIIQSTYVLPYERCCGNFDLKAPNTLYAVTLRLNAAIAESARYSSGVLLNDIEGIASHVGRRAWFDERLWVLAKTFCSLDQLPLVAQNLVDIVLSTRGKAVKCIVLDLDNTLWGGVIGDDGLDGIKLAAHGDGESFYLFQSYLLELKKRGILLAVCSKNNHSNAILPFESHPDMLIRPKHISVFLANWDNKAANVERIKATLNIGYDSMVFLDDNPFERNLIREKLPDVIVPELPEDPADYVQAISELNLFEISTLSAEDANRSDLYRQEAQRKELEASFSDVGDFLQSLNMKMDVARFDKFHLPRIGQLIQRSNQFNLTTHRYNEAECERMMNDYVGYIPLYATLHDRFGDHGLISVIVLQRRSGTFHISDWLMSCRVLARGVEQFLMNHVVRLAEEERVTWITGEYLPTAKNAMVKEFYAQFGFKKTGAGRDGATQWALDRSAYEYNSVHITPMEVTSSVA
jgi:FkbH-like protein